MARWGRWERPLGTARSPAARFSTLGTQPDPPWQRMRADVSDDAPDLHASLERLASAVMEVQRSGSREQRRDAERQLAQTRRTLYAILADDSTGGESASSPRPD